MGKALLGNAGENLGLLGLSSGRGIVCGIVAFDFRPLSFLGLGWVHPAQGIQKKLPPAPHTTPPQHRDHTAGSSVCGPCPDSILSSVSGIMEGG